MGNVILVFLEAIQKFEETFQKFSFEPDHFLVVALPFKDLKGLIEYENL